VTDHAAGENRTQQVSHVSRSLKSLARELDCPVIALLQLSCATEQRSPPVPILSDLRESGGIEQDSDVVLMLDRPELCNEGRAELGLTEVCPHESTRPDWPRGGILRQGADALSRVAGPREPVSTGGGRASLPPRPRRFVA
jgi:hypothetical protein